jgi:hypothetical protein
MEQKVRVYQPRKKKDSDKLERFVVNPSLRVLGFGSKQDRMDKKAKKSRLTA